MRHVITSLVENQPGVLARVVGLISGRGFNIETLNVAPTQDSSLSRLNMTVHGDEKVLEQITKQLNKLVEVVRVTDLTRKRFFNRELVLLEIEVNKEQRHELAELEKLADIKIDDVKDTSMIIRIVGEHHKIEATLKLLKPYKILNMSQSGVTTLD